MTKVVFIASALFLLSVIFKSNLERPGEAVPAEVATSDSWSNKVAGLATGLNELLASEPTGAGQTADAKSKAALGQLNPPAQSTPSKVIVREEVVDPAQYDPAFAKLEDGKLASVLPQTKAGVNTAGLPSASSSLAGLPASTVPFASNNGGVSNSANAGSGAGQSPSGNIVIASRQLADPSANNARGATVPLASNLTDSQTSVDAIPKVTEQAGKFYVQYGIFSSACRSEQVKEKLAQAGIHSVMDKLDPEGAQWIVKSKAYASRAEAIYNLQTAQRKGYESYLVTAN